MHLDWWSQRYLLANPNLITRHVSFAMRNPTRSFMLIMSLHVKYVMLCPKIMFILTYVMHMFHVLCQVYFIPCVGTT